MKIIDLKILKQNVKVPGQSFEDSNKTAKLAVTLIYIFFGLALLSMCFDLVQAILVNELIIVAKKIGLIDKDNTDYDKNDDVDDDNEDDD
jgi:hypothetical protein